MSTTRSTGSNSWDNEETRRIWPDDDKTSAYRLDDEPTRVVDSGNEPTQVVGNNEATRAIYSDEPTQAFEPPHEPTRVMPVQDFQEATYETPNVDYYPTPQPQREPFEDYVAERFGDENPAPRQTQPDAYGEDYEVESESPRKSLWRRFLRNMGVGIALSAIYALCLFLAASRNGNLDTTSSSIVVGALTGVVCTIVASLLNLLLNVNGNMRSFISFIGLLYVLEQWLKIIQTQGFGSFPFDEQLTAMLPIGLTVCGLIGGTLDKLLDLLDTDPNSKVGFVLRTLSIVSGIVAIFAGVTAFCAFGTQIGVYLTPWGQNSTLLPSAVMVLAIISVGLALALPKLSKIMKLLGYAAFLGSVGLGVFAILGYQTNPLLSLILSAIN